MFQRIYSVLYIHQTILEVPVSQKIQQNQRDFERRSRESAVEWKVEPIVDSHAFLTPL